MSTAASPPSIAPATVQVEPVTNKRMLMEFICFPFSLYRDDPAWVPPFVEERRDFLDPQKNPFFEHARAQLFLARRNGELVGTISAAVDDDYNALHGERVGTWGFFECVDNPEVAAALLAAAEQWARAQGMMTMRGPYSFSSNHECGLLIDGFDDPPMVMMTYNPHYYAALVEGCGYRKAMDLFAYVGDLDERWINAPPKVFHAAEAAMHKQGIRVRKANRRDFEREVQRVKDVYRQAWERNWGFVPLTEHEADHLARSLKPVIDADLVLIAETAEGRPVGMSLTLPDLHQALKWSGGGRMWPFGVLKFLWHKRKINQIRLVLMGVVAEYRGRGIDAVFYVETARVARAKGYKRIEGSWILETNTMMNRIIERLGGRRYKTYRIYEKAL